VTPPDPPVTPPDDDDGGDRGDDDDGGDRGDDDEGEGGRAGIIRTSTGDGADPESDDAREASLPFSGTNVLGMALAGLLALAGGLLLRRRGELPGAP
jgi:hypothetical protein